MKKLLLILTLLIPISAYGGDYQFYFFGVNANVINRSNWKQVTLGAVSAIAVHTAGHLIYGKITNSDVTFTGLTKETIHNASQSEKENFARAGFVAQSLVGLVLTSFEKTRQSSFTKGYIVASALETWSYPIRNRSTGDLSEVSDLEFAGYSLISLHNLLRVDFKK